jgi:peptidoglycan/LPS O-acetylase OafA/YrhL
VKRIPSLDGLRAISIAAVVLGHLGKSGHGPQIFREVYADTGVRLFFVISGFLITKILVEEHDQTSSLNLKNFYLRRALRIFPAAFVFLALALVFYWHDIRWDHLVAASLYVANFDPARPWIFGHLWSLGVEEQFYLLWPGILTRWYEKRKTILVGILVLAPICRLALYCFKVPGGDYGGYPWATSNLASGCLLAMFAPRLPRIRISVGLVMALGVLLIPLFAANTAARTLLQVFILQPILCLSMAGVLLHVVQTPYRFLNSGPISWLGRISYSLYLWQQPFCSDPHLRHGYFVVFAVAAAALSYYCVEQPILRWRDRRTLGLTGQHRLLPLAPASSAA